MDDLEEVQLKIEAKKRMAKATYKRLRPENDIKTLETAEKYLGNLLDDYEKRRYRVSGTEVVLDQGTMTFWFIADERDLKIYHSLFPQGKPCMNGMHQEQFFEPLGQLYEDLWRKISQISHHVDY